MPLPPTSALDADEAPEAWVREVPGTDDDALSLQHVQKSGRVLREVSGWISSWRSAPSL